MTQCSGDYKDIRYVVLNPYSYRPTRLVQLVSPDKARVVRTKEARLTTKDLYASLSRCCRQHRPTTLLTTNEPEMKAGFNTNTLVQTFRKTVHAPWLLCMHCIWIKSLCIPQASAKDWQREAAMMDNSYRFAVSTSGRHALMIAR